MGLEIIPTPFRVTRTFMGNPQLWNHHVSANGCYRFPAQKVRAADIPRAPSKYHWAWVLGKFSLAGTGNGFKHDPG